MICATPDIRDGIGFALDSESIQLYASILWFVPHVCLTVSLFVCLSTVAHMRAAVVASSGNVLPKRNGNAARSRIPAAACLP